MAIHESSKLTSSYRHTKSIATYGTIHSERNSETSWANPTYHINEEERKKKKNTEIGRGDWEIISP